MPSRSLRALVVPLVLACLGPIGCHEPAETESTDAPPSAVDAVATEAFTPSEPEERTFTPARAGCDVLPVYVAGAAAGSICAEDAPGEGLTVIDLSDAWTPRVFRPSDSGHAPEYREKYLELARQSRGDLGLYGIQPTLSVLAARLGDEERSACDAKVDLGPLAEGGRSKEAITAAQAALVCAGLLKKNAVTGRLGGSTHPALEAFRRRHMIVGAGLDDDTQRALALGGDELAFRGLLRALRERVADAAGLVEDGSAVGERVLVQSRDLELSRFAPFAEPLPDGATDLVGAATDVAARELGWSSPEAARAFVDRLGPAGLRDLRVAVELPAAPSYHSKAMDLRVVIDRGDVLYERPGAAAAKRRQLSAPRGPTFVVYAKDGERDVALVRWSTTIGGWKKERTSDGEMVLKYKESDVGDRVWRRVIAAPAWMPPESTPESDLLRASEDGSVALKRDLVMPGYRNAYGLVTLLHEEAVSRDGGVEYLDHGIRTHGSVDYRSITNGTSHGCHRLYNHLALRLSGFVLDHRTHIRRGKMRAGYERTLAYKDQTVTFEIQSRGYLYELDPPVPVEVLEGRIAGEERSPLRAIRLDPEQASG